MLLLLVFLVAIFQDLLVTTWTRAVALRRVGLSTSLSFVTSAISLSAVMAVVRSGDPWFYILAWALGSAAGTFLSFALEPLWKSKSTSASPAPSAEA